MSREHDPGAERDPLFAALADAARKQAAVENAATAEPGTIEDPPPPSAETRRAIVQEILRRQADDRTPEAHAAPAADGPTGDTGDTDDTGEPTAEIPVLPFPERFRRHRPWIAAAVAALAVIAIGLWPPSSDIDPDDGPRLPAYQAELLGATRTERSTSPPATPNPAPEGRLEGSFTVGNRLELLLRPEERLTTTPVASTWRWQDGAWQPWSAPVEVLDGGTVRLHGTLGVDLSLEPGEHRLALVIALAPADIDIDVDMDEAAPESGVGRTFVLELTVEAGASP